MTAEELCDKALAAGHDCTVTISTGPVDQTLWWVWAIAGTFAFCVLVVVVGLIHSDWQEHRTKRNETDARTYAQTAR